MSIIKLIDNLHITKEKELFYLAYQKWCNLIYGKYGKSEELITVFIKDVCNIDNLHIDKNILYTELNKPNTRRHLISDNHRTTSWFDDHLHKFLDNDFN